MDEKPKSKKEKTKEVLRRAMWGSMALLFVFTGVFIGVIYFWQAIHPSKTDSSQQQANSCQFNIVSGQPTLAVPKAYKPQGDVTKLETTDLQTGSGKTVKPGDCLTVKYYGTLAANGQKFDEDFTTPQALKFPIGQGQVIPGWDEGLVGMKVGGTRRLVIPSVLAYGSQASGAIPANSDLVFVVNLLTDQ